MNYPSLRGVPRGPLMNCPERLRPRYEKAMESLAAKGAKIAWCRWSSPMPKAATQI
jgi:hypothetical protein